jgi:hypothetical protein
MNRNRPDRGNPARTRLAIDGDSRPVPGAVATPINPPAGAPGRTDAAGR